MMTTASKNHPDAVLDSLLAKGVRSNKRDHLLQMHELCRKQHQSGSRDFSLPAIGRLAEGQKIFSTGRTLNNAPSADYRALIEAWAAYAGPPGPKSPKAHKQPQTYEYVKRIPDPALRSKVLLIIAERDDLKAQLNTIKGATQLEIVQRPGEPMRTTIVPRQQPGTFTPAPPTQTPIVLPPFSELTRTEREALMNSISPEYLRMRGLHIGDGGEILDRTGRTVFAIRFVNAVRKMLRQPDPAQKSVEPVTSATADEDDTIEITTERDPVAPESNARRSKSRRNSGATMINHG
jgi:hypothetical protein